MTNHSNYRYLKVSPRGFANEVTYYRVPIDKVAEVEAEYAGYEDDVTRGGYTCWTRDKLARSAYVDWRPVPTGAFAAARA